MATDEQIGKNLTRLRGDITQKELAEDMRELGFKWSQATVWSVEKGERPLRLAEADALSDLLGASINMLASDGGQLDVTLLFRKVSSAFDGIHDLVPDLFDAQKSLTIGTEGYIDDEIRRIGLRESPITVAWRSMVEVIEGWDAYRRTATALDEASDETFYESFGELEDLVDFWRAEIERARPTKGAHDGEHQATP